MTEITKETVTTEENVTPEVRQVRVSNKADSYETTEYLIFFIFGALEVLLLFRLILKVTGASVQSAFVSLIYGLTGIFIMPFEGIFRKGYAPGVETTSVLEPAVIVAIIVYAVLAFGIVKLIRVLSGEKQEN
ncbi:YggT family protein [candidate division WWE3 bacterium CG10_big_fil_rev_8_21_14_0_10_32_10]|uniref:YggT family protein n=1 Tax=candidate division WWE3 bacterium CG10_big_fil_rev_8_21_14_0_10_32_10 TaxID=1975090 RepID=A0A2H0R920_UNCKA|nr:MAG: YggT family protein [candidate division WWE3 bacterium CG10_big_fil_rev_8_21_14_0_10_32_10]